MSDLESKEKINKRVRSNSLTKIKIIPYLNLFLAKLSASKLAEVREVTSYQRFSLFTHRENKKK